MLNLHSRCSEKIIVVFCFDRKIHSSLSFRPWAKEFRVLYETSSGFVGKCCCITRGDVWGKSFPYQKYFIFERSAKKESWSTCFRHMCENFFPRVNWKNVRKTFFTGKISDHVFVGLWEKSFQASGEKLRSSSEKVSWEVRKLLSFSPKRLLKKIEIIVERNELEWKYQTWAKKSDFLSDYFFSSFLGRLCKFCGRNLDINFFVKKIFF